MQCVSVEQIRRVLTADVQSSETVGYHTSHCTPVLTHSPQYHLYNFHNLLDQTEKVQHISSRLSASTWNQNRSWNKDREINIMKWLKSPPHKSLGSTQLIKIMMADHIFKCQIISFESTSTFCLLQQGTDPIKGHPSNDIRQDWNSVLVDIDG